MTNIMDGWRERSREIALDLVQTEMTLREQEAPDQLDRLRAQEARAGDRATALIEELGYDLSDSDSAGDELRNAVFDALVFALLRMNIGEDEEDATPA